MDVLTKEQRRRNMQAIRAKGTRAERLLGCALWRRGMRYRKNNRRVFGNPDLTFSKLKLAIFVDGEFFHGRDWETKKHRIQSNRDFWWPKIEGNMKRDQLVADRLQSLGWAVLRFWDTDVMKNLDRCILRVEQTIDKIKNAD